MEYQLDIFHTFGKNDGVAGQLEPKMNLSQQHEVNFGIPIDYKKTMTQEEEELYSNFRSTHGFLFLLACDKNTHAQKRSLEIQFWIYSTDTMQSKTLQATSMYFFISVPIIQRDQQDKNDTN